MRWKYCDSGYKWLDISVGDASIIGWKLFRGDAYDVVFLHGKKIVRLNIARSGLVKCIKEMVVANEAS